MPIHIFFGLFGFVLALLACLLGLSEKAFFAMPNGEYSEMPNQGVLINSIGILLIAFGGMVVYLVTEPSYKRQPLSEDAMLLTGDER